MEEKKFKEEILKEIDELKKEEEPKEEPKETFEKKPRKVTKIKKEDRAYLYFRENALGNLNIKFGPEKYTKDTEKFYEILMYGTFKGISFLSGLTKKEPIMKRREHYNTISTSLSAVVNESFPDVFEMLKKEAEDEMTALKRVEEGHEVSPEFQKKFDEAKEKLKSRFSQKTTTTVSENNEKLAKDIEGQIELFTEVRESMMKEWGFDPNEDFDDTKKEFDDYNPRRIVWQLLESKIYDLSKQLQTHYVSKEEQN